MSLLTPNCLAATVQHLHPQLLPLAESLTRRKEIQSLTQQLQHLNPLELRRTSTTYKDKNPNQIQLTEAAD